MNAYLFVLYAKAENVVEIDTDVCQLLWYDEFLCAEGNCEAVVLHFSD